MPWLNTGTSAHSVVFVIGINPHKSTHTATAVDPDTNRDLGSIRIRSSFDDYIPKQWPDRIWAVENASGLGHHLTQWLTRCCGTGRW